MQTTTPRQRCVYPRQNNHKSRSIRCLDRFKKRDLFKNHAARVQQSKEVVLQNAQSQPYLARASSIDRVERKASTSPVSKRPHGMEGYDLYGHSTIKKLWELSRRRSDTRRIMEHDVQQNRKDWGWCSSVGESHVVGIQEEGRRSYTNMRRRDYKGGLVHTATDTQPRPYTAMASTTGSNRSRRYGSRRDAEEEEEEEYDGMIAWSTDIRKIPPPARDPYALSSGAAEGEEEQQEQVEFTRVPWKQANENRASMLHEGAYALDPDYPTPPASSRDPPGRNPLLRSRPPTALQLIQQSERRFRRPTTAFSLHSPHTNSSPQLPKTSSRHPSNNKAHAQNGPPNAHICRPMSAVAVRNDNLRISQQAKYQLASSGISVPLGVIERGLTAPDAQMFSSEERKRHFPVAWASLPSDPTPPVKAKKKKKGKGKGKGKKKR